MDSKGNIVGELEKTLIAKEKELENLDSYQALKTANDLYNKMIDEGVATKRGFTLRGIEDSHLFQVKLNASFNLK